MLTPSSWSGFLRADGRLGIRNNVLVIYLVECAHHVARAIVAGAGDSAVQLVGFPGCYPNGYALQMMKQLANPEQEREEQEMEEQERKKKTEEAEKQEERIQQHPAPVAS